jgi:hypothetical protein
MMNKKNYNKLTKRNISFKTQKRFLLIYTNSKGGVIF